MPPRGVPVIFISVRMVEVNGVGRTDAVIVFVRPDLLCVAKVLYS